MKDDRDYYKPSEYDLWLGIGAIFFIVWLILTVLSVTVLFLAPAPYKIIGFTILLGCIVFAIWMGLRV